MAVRRISCDEASPDNRDREAIDQIADRLEALARWCVAQTEKAVADENVLARLEAAPGKNLCVIQDLCHSENDVLFLVASGGPKHQAQTGSGALGSIGWIHIGSADQWGNWVNWRAAKSIGRTR